MADLTARIAALSPQQRALLTRRIKLEGGAPGAGQRAALNWAPIPRLPRPLERAGHVPPLLRPAAPVVHVPARPPELPLQRPRGYAPAGPRGRPGPGAEPAGAGAPARDAAHHHRPLPGWGGAGRRAPRRTRSPCPWSTSAGSPPPSARGPCGSASTPRPGAPSTSSPVPSCGRPCCGWRTTTTSCWWWCTTSSPTAGRRG